MYFYERLQLLAREKGVYFNQVESSIGFSCTRCIVIKQKSYFKMDFIRRELF